MIRVECTMMAEVSPCELVLALGHDWVACADALPWNDCRSWLRYVVYSPSYGGDLFICRFELCSETSWWHERMQLGISGVTHWRLAMDDEQDFGNIDGPLPGVTSVNADALTQLRRWWSWYCDYNGIDNDEQRHMESAHD